MKIGIMTYWWSDDNYGQLMQAYALQRYLRDQGYDAFIIRYFPQNDIANKITRVFKIFNPQLLYKFIERKIKIRKNAKNQMNTIRNFTGFRSEHISLSDVIYTKYDDLVKNTPDVDILICGSDQIWNYPDKFKNDVNKIKAYFLNFGGKNIKKISYAASFGKDKVNNNFSQYIKSLLKDFDIISVREDTGVEILEKSGISNPYHVLDPTMLLTADHYKTLISDTPSVEKYCFAYLLGNKCNIEIDQVADFTVEKSLKLKYTASQNRVDNYKKTNPTINEWLALINYSEFVITNSFHGMVFAIIMNKKFCVIPLKGDSYTKSNSRITSLLKKLGLLNHIFNNNLNDIYNMEVNWEAINNNIKNDLHTNNFWKEFKKLVNLNS